LEFDKPTVNSPALGLFPPGSEKINTCSSTVKGNDNTSSSEKSFVGHQQDLEQCIGVVLFLHVQAQSGMLRDIGQGRPLCRENFPHSHAAYRSQLLKRNAIDLEEKGFLSVFLMLIQ
jgi:hypothetical protein